MLYQYKALKNGETVIKKIEATSPEMVVDYLQKNDYFPITVEEVKANDFSFLVLLHKRLILMIL